MTGYVGSDTAEKRIRVQINYKSGQSVTITCTSFKVQMSLGRLISATWENARPNPLHAGVSEIESVWELS